MWQAILRKNAFVNRDQRSSKEWNQASQILSIKKKTFKEAAEVLDTSSTTVIRRFKKAYELKELYCTWFDWAKTTTDIPAFSKAIRRRKAFVRNKQIEKVE